MRLGYPLCEFTRDRDRPGGLLRRWRRNRHTRRHRRHLRGHRRGWFVRLPSENCRLFRLRRRLGGSILWRVSDGNWRRRQGLGLSRRISRGSGDICRAPSPRRCPAIRQRPIAQPAFGNRGCLFAFHHRLRRRGDLWNGGRRHRGSRGTSGGFRLRDRCGNVRRRRSHAGNRDFRRAKPLRRPQLKQPGTNHP